MRRNRREAGPRAGSRLGRSSAVLAGLIAGGVTLIAGTALWAAEGASESAAPDTVAAASSAAASSGSATSGSSESGSGANASTSTSTSSSASTPAATPAVTPSAGAATHPSPAKASKPAVSSARTHTTPESKASGVAAKTPKPSTTAKATRTTSPAPARIVLKTSPASGSSATPVASTPKSKTPAAKSSTTETSPVRTASSITRVTAAPPRVASPAPVRAEQPVVAQEERVIYHYNALGRRDPFQALIGGGFVGMDVGGDAPPDVGGIKVVGIVWGASDKFALVEDPRGNSMVLREGDKVTNGVVEGLKRDALIVRLTVDGLSQSVTIPVTRKGEDSNEGK